MNLSRLSTQYVKIPVSATEGGVPIDVTVDAVAVAVVAPGSLPVTGDWKAGEWEVAGTVTLARLLVGPGGDVQPAAGRHDVWVRVSDSPEVPVQKAGQLVIT